MKSNEASSGGWWRSCRWTIGLACLLLVLNSGHLPGVPAAAGGILNWLQYDRDAIAAGECWRLLTCNLVHWSREHFWLDVGAFVIVGVLYERQLGRLYSWLLLASAVAVGLALFVFRPDLQTYRGLSGVDSGQFAAALAIECLAAIRDRRRLCWFAPAAIMFFTKITYEALSGRMFFGTEGLGNIGVPVPLAHVAGVIATGALLTVVACTTVKRSNAIVCGTAAYACPWRAY